MAMFSTFLIYVLTDRAQVERLAVDPDRRRRIDGGRRGHPPGAHPPAGEAQRARPGDPHAGPVLRPQRAGRQDLGNPTPQPRSRQPFPGRARTTRSTSSTGRRKFFVTYKAIGVWATVAVLVILVNLLLKRTKLGLAYRAVAANAESSVMVGIPVQRMLMLGWALAAGIGTDRGGDHRRVPRRARLQLHGRHPAVRLRRGRAGRVRLDHRRRRRRPARRAHRDVRARASSPPSATSFSLVMVLAVIMIVLYFRPQGLFGSKRVERV